MNTEPEKTDKFIYTEAEIENISKLVKWVLKVRARLPSKGIDVDTLAGKVAMIRKIYAALDAEID